MNPASSAPGQTESSRETVEQGQMQDAALQAMHAQLAREKGEPQEGFAPLPLTIVAICCALSFFCGVYLVENAGGFHSMVYDEHLKTDEEAAAPAERNVFAAGQRVYAGQCASCHQASGLGVAGVYPPLAGSEWVLNGSPNRVINILLHGLQGPIEVKGNTYNGVMPAFPTWNDTRISDVLTYIRTNADWGNQATPITPEMVAEVRAQYASRGSAWSAPELLQLYPLDAPAPVPVPPTAEQ